NHRPDDLTVQAELLYNRYGNTRPFAYICLLIGLLAFGLVCRSMVLRRRIRRRWTMGLSLFAALALLYLTFTLALRSMVSGHLPFSNGYETMQLMAFCSLLFTLPFMRRFPLAGAVGVLTCGLTLLVAGMGQSQPQITPLMPVLHSPLLSWHVVIVMAAYVLLAFVMLISLAALIIHYTRRDAGEVVMRMQAFDHVMLVPAVFLLAIGIFIGAVWANISWGRYWGWDPKETWALITLLVYALPLHAGSYSAFRRPTVFHLYCVVAFLCVLMTYFGVNHLLGGMHSYAG
ncbi:MAG: cytochrome c biogenesis protein CcsA, partial [Bacteroidaceae bacterium]|nr:cytochrome c biogenesis protein CcsA [Bacteroidaceae bacterium]